MSIYSTNADINGNVLLGASSKVVFTPGTQDDFGIDKNTEDAGWQDIPSPVIIRGSGQNNPTITTVTGLNFECYTFDSTSTMHQCYSVVHLNHDYRPGTGVYFHVHTLTDTVNPVGNFKLNIDYQYAKTGEVFSPMATVSIIDSYSAALQHKISEISSPVLAGVLEPDSVILMRIYRQANDVLDTLNSDVHLLFIDCHVQVSKFSTKYKDKSTTGSFYS